jgi:type IV pilus assembly protein PilF
MAVWNQVSLKVASSRYLRALPLVIMLVVFGGCVTTEESMFSSKLDEAKAVETRVQIAIQYLRENDSEMAKKNLFWAMDISKDNPRVHEVLGLTYQGTGENELAREHFEKMLKFDPSYSRGRNNYAAFLFQQKDYKGALKHFQKVVEDVYYENLPAAYGNLGRSALQLEEYDLAEKSLLRALKMERRVENAQYVLELADIYYKKGNYPQSNQYFDKYRSLVKQSSARALLLGVKIAEKFDDKDAAASYALALRNLYPRSHELLEYQKSHD